MEPRPGLSLPLFVVRFRIVSGVGTRRARRSLESGDPFLGGRGHEAMYGVRLNCWQYQGCGRQPGGVNADEGVCPAATTESLDGSNRGHMAGRACWVVSGTLCDGAVAGTHEHKAVECRRCAFFRRVEVEEGLDYEYSRDLLSRYSVQLVD